MFLILGILPTTESSETLKKVTEGIQQISPLVALLLVTVLNNERNQNRVYIKHLRWSLDFSEKNVQYFRDELKNTRKKIKEKQAE
jgi:hypothetical protein